MNIIIRKIGCSKDTLSNIVVQSRSRPSISSRKDGDYAIRWGCLRKTRASVLANKIDAILLASNKAMSREVFNAFGLNTPRTSRDHQRLDWIGPNTEWIHRPDRHHGGRDFFIGTGRQLARQRLLDYGGYISILIDKKAEYRVHVAHGRVLGIQHKPFEDGKAPANHAIGKLPWVVLTRKDWSARMCRLAIAATKVLGLDFGGVDIIFDGKKYYVLEVNTAPRITSKILSGKYARYIDWVFAKQQPVHHFDTTSKREGAGFAWREKDFNQ